MHDRLQASPTKPYNPYRLPNDRSTLNRAGLPPDNSSERFTVKGHPMSVQLQQFRVVGVNTATGEDVSIILDAATKAAAEVKADQMGIQTTHIVRIKHDEPTPDEHELFSTEAAEALTSKRTDKLIEEVAAPQESAAKPAPVVRTPLPVKPQPHNDITAITRPNYTAPRLGPEPIDHNVSGLRAFSFVLLMLLLITAGCYFVLVHEPNKIKANTQELVFGQDLFIDVIAPSKSDPQAPDMRDAFGNLKRQTPMLSANPTPKAQAEAASAAGQPPQPPTPSTTPTPTLELQSIVTSHEGRFAVINGKLYKQGASVQGYKLVNVADDWVLMEKDGKQFTLQIEADGNQ